MTRRTPDGDPPHPDCLAALDHAVDLLLDLGHEVFERDLVELTPHVGKAIGRPYGAAVDWTVRYWVRQLGREPGPDDLEPLTRLYHDRAQRVTGGELLMAQTTVQAFGRDVARALTEFDAWLSTLATPPPAVGHLTTGDVLEDERRSAELVAFPLVTANLIGAPAMSVPLALERRRPADRRTRARTVRRRGHPLPSRRPARGGSTLGPALARRLGDSIFNHRPATMNGCS